MSIDAITNAAWAVEDFLEQMTGVIDVLWALPDEDPLSLHDECIEACLIMEELRVGFKDGLVTTESYLKRPAAQRALQFSSDRADRIQAERRAEEKETKELKYSQSLDRYMHKDTTDEDPANMEVSISDEQLAKRCKGLKDCIETVGEVVEDTKVRLRLAESLLDQRKQVAGGAA